MSTRRAPGPVHFFSEFLDRNSFDELVPAVRTAMRGERYVSPGGRH